MVEQQNPSNLMGGITELTLSTHIDELEVVCESIIDFESQKLNRFDLTRHIASQGWESFFHYLKGLVYPSLVKDLWIHVVTIDNLITSSVMGKKISILKNIVKPMSHGDHGRRCYNMDTKEEEIKLVVYTIFKPDANNTTHMKNRWPNLRI